jgi:hypothetical protein
VSAYFSLIESRSHDRSHRTTLKWPFHDRSVLLCGTTLQSDSSSRTQFRVFQGRTGQTPNCRPPRLLSELVAAVARHLAEPDRPLASWTAFVPMPDVRRACRFGPPFCGVPICLDAFHPRSIGSSLGTLGMDSLARVARLAADRANALRRGVYEEQRHWLLVGHWRFLQPPYDRRHRRPRQGRIGGGASIELPIHCTLAQCAFGWLDASTSSQMLHGSPTGRCPGRAPILDADFASAVVWTTLSLPGTKERVLDLQNRGGPPVVRSPKDPAGGSTANCVNRSLNDDHGKRLASARWPMSEREIFRPPSFRLSDRWRPLSGRSPSRKKRRSRRASRQAVGRLGSEFPTLQPGRSLAVDQSRGRSPVCRQDLGTGAAPRS